MKVLYIKLLLLAVISVNGGMSVGRYPHNLSQIDRLLYSSPEQALDSLSMIDEQSLTKGDKAYYYLLKTIAQHKNHISFYDDSIISLSRNYYVTKTHDYYNQARSLFYNGLILYKLSFADTMAYHYMLSAERIVNDHSIHDNRLIALIHTYLGKINDFNGNYESASNHYQKAIDIEDKLGNYRNELLDYCELLICLTSGKDSLQAERTFDALNLLLSNHPDFHSSRLDNAKAIFFLHCRSQLDSALYYSLCWNPSPADMGAKNKLLASIYRKKGEWGKAIEYEKIAFVNRREADKEYYHVYYRNLADLYANWGYADSTSHYATLAYVSLLESYEQKANKRILELEKQYDIATKEAALDRVRRDRNIVIILFIALLIIVVLLIREKELVRKNTMQLQREAKKDAVAKSVVSSVLATYAGVNKRLAIIHNLPDKDRQEALNQFIQENKSNISRNLQSLLEGYHDTLPEIVRKVDELLEGTQKRTVFILTEMDFNPNEIGRMLGISSSQVRMVKKAIRDKISLSSLAHVDRVQQLHVMQVKDFVRKKQ